MGAELSYAYGLMDVHVNSLEEVSCLLNAFARAVLSPGFLIPPFFTRIPWAQPLPGWDEHF
jgi:hypothetical protein